MKKRVQAITLTFNLLLMIIQIVIGFGILAKNLASGALSDWFFGSSSFISSGFSSPFDDRIKGPITFLVVILLFMLFTFILFNIIPAAVRKKEKDPEIESYFD